MTRYVTIPENLHCNSTLIADRMPSASQQENHIENDYCPTGSHSLRAGVG